MFQRLFVRLPAVAGVDALQALAHDRPQAGARALGQAAFGPRPALVLGILVVIGVALGAGQFAAGHTLGPPWLPTLGTLCLVVALALRLRPALAQASVRLPALRGVLAGLLPTLALSAFGQALVIPVILAEPAETALVALGLRGVAQLAWSAALLVGLLSARRWWLGVVEPSLIGLSAGVGLEVAWAVGELGVLWSRPWVVHFAPAHLPTLFDLLHGLADLGAAVGVWTWVLAVAWLLGSELIPAGRPPTHLPVVDTLRSVARALRGGAGQKAPS